MSKREQKLVIVPANEHHGVYIEDEITGRTVCDFYFMKGEKVVPFHDAEANAQKLVASLDMLEALEGAATWLESWQSAEPYLSTIKAAISKAAGGGGVKTVKVEATIKTPRVPNFVMSECEQLKLMVGDLTDESLRELGAAWTEALLENAKRQREQESSHDK